MRVRSEYINHRKQNDHHSSESTKDNTKEETSDIVQKAKDLFGEDTVNIIDE